MRYYALLVLVSAASYAVVSCAAAMVVRFVWTLWRARARDRAFAAERTGLLVTLRFTPGALGGAACLTLTGVFVRFEPRDTTEAIGWLLGSAAALSAVLAVSALLRIVRSARATLECSRLVRTCGRRWPHPEGLPIWLVDTRYPIAAVAGVLRPRLLISTRIIEECSPQEADAIIRHEAAHLRRRDNLLRAIMLALPDPLPFTRGGRELQDAWSAAAEQAADEEAAGANAERRADLASALVRVARMADGTAPLALPGVAFYEGFGLEARVRRLLAPARAVRSRSMGILALSLLLLAAAGGVLSDAIAHPLHQAIEAAVGLLP